MASVTVLEKFDYQQQKREKMEFKGKDGELVEIAEREAKNLIAVLCEINDMSGHRITFTLPENYIQPIEIGDTLQINCKKLETLTEFFPIKEVLRHQQGKKK